MPSQISHSVRALLCLAILSTTSAQAETKTSSFQVGMDVTASCALSASTLTFNAMPTGTTAGTDAAADISVSCSQGTAYQISLSQGSNFSGGRRMANGSSYINYELYSDPARSTVWSTSQVISFTGNGSAQSHTIFGRVPAGQSVPNTGSYADTIVATISY
jgi:spore coat protein U-like protein